MDCHVKIRIRADNSMAASYDVNTTAPASRIRAGSYMFHNTSLALGGDDILVVHRVDQLLQG
jgi:hypothetical protein